MISNTRAVFLKTKMDYTGVELRPHFTYEKTGVLGSSLLVFTGACKVATGDLVDWEDRRVGDFIEAKQMLHFIAELFGTTLETAVFAQRLFVAIVKDELQASGVRNAVRSGDDLFIRGRKFSVSIATVSPTSCLIHWGFNIDSAGAPVKAIGFKDLGWNAAKIRGFAKTVSEKFCLEMDSIRDAQMKVKAV